MFSPFLDKWRFPAGFQPRRRIEQDQFQRSRDGSAISADELVVLGPREVRTFDTATSVQSGHVSDYREGDWRHILNAQQRSRLEALLFGATEPVPA